MLDDIMAQAHDAAPHCPAGITFDSLMALFPPSAPSKVDEVLVIMNGYIGIHTKEY